jgi:hypothetical protein
MATKKAGRKNRQPAPGTTAVKDRVVGMPLGREAQMIAQYLRGGGARAELVPDMRDDVARSDWTVGRARAARRVPMWMLDWAVSVLEQIPQRSRRKPGRAKTEAVRNVEFWAQTMPVAEAARMEAKLEATRQRDYDGDFSEGEADKIEKRAEDLARAVYRSRKPDMP